MVKNKEVIDELIDINDIQPASVSVRLCKIPVSENIKELAYSIREHGLLQSIIVRPINGCFEIIAGHRRFYACKLLRWKKIPARVVSFSDREAFEVQLVENMQRMTMDPIEEAEAFRKYILDYGWGGVSQLAIVVSKSEQYVSSRIQLLKLPQEIIERITKDGLKVSHALELRALSEDRQKAIAEEIVSKNLSLRQVREITKHEKLDYGYEREIAKDEDNCNLMPCLDYKYSTLKQVKLLKKTLLSLRISLSRIDGLIEDTNEQLREDQRANIICVLMEFRLAIHSMIDKNLRLISELRSSI